MTGPTGDRTVIVGGGIIGIACAHYLAEAGHAVTVVDRATIGSGSSRGNLGFICPSRVLPMNEPSAIREGLASLFNRRAAFRVKPQLRLDLYRWMAEFARRCTHGRMIEAGRDLQPLLALSMQEYLELFEVLPSDTEWKHSGLAFAFRSQAALDGFVETDTLLTDTYGITASRIEAADLPAFDPALRDDLAGAFIYRGDGFVRPESLIQAWQSHLTDQGVEFWEDCPVADVHTENARVVGLDTVRGELKADHYVFATGAWSPEFGSQLGCRIPIEPGKGYSVTMNRPSVCPTHPMLFPEHHIAMSPYADGYRIGSMMEFVGYDTSIPEHRITQLTESAAHYLKEPTGSETFETWYGWRPMTWDSLPIIGRSPGLDNAVLATGHNMLGIALAAGTGRLISDLVSERPSGIDISAFSANRF